MVKVPQMSIPCLSWSAVTDPIPNCLFLQLSMTRLIFSLMGSDSICRKPPNPEVEASDVSLQKKLLELKIFSRWGDH
jgi:hypothetical protein